MATNIKYWQDLIKNAPQSYQKWFEEEQKYLRAHIKPQSHVLDVGCGDGRSIRDILELTTSVVGIDHDLKAVLAARDSFKEYPDVKILLEDALEMSFTNDCFDYVICMGTFANFAEKKHGVLREMKRVLNPAGHTIISVFSEDAFEERMKVYRGSEIKIREIRGTTVVFDEEVGDNISEQFTQEQLENIFSEVGFEVEDITKVNMAYLCKLSK